MGDLYFNGVASDVERTLDSGGLQADGSYALGDKHTLRVGIVRAGRSGGRHELHDHSLQHRVPGDVDLNGIPTMPAFPIANSATIHGYFAGAYLQDEWKLFTPLTLNYGARFDVFDSSFDHENQLSPRANLIYQPTESTTLHGGYSRYFTPPPLENVPAGDVHQFDGTSNQATYGPNAPDGAVKAERANYFDAGVLPKISRRDCRWAWTAITRERGTSSMTGCLGRR